MLCRWAPPPLRQGHKRRSVGVFCSMEHALPAHIPPSMASKNAGLKPCQGAPTLNCMLLVRSAGSC